MKSKIFFALFFILLIGSVGAVASIGIEVIPSKNEYAIDEDITISIFVQNKGEDPGDTMTGIGFEVSGFSVLDPSINIFQATFPPVLSVPPDTISGPVNYTNIDTIGLDPGVYTFTVIITNYVSGSGDDTIISDNIDSASIVLVRAPPTSVPEIPVVFIIFIVLAVLFIVRKN